MPRVALVGSPKLLAACAPASGQGLEAVRVEGPATAGSIAAARPDAVLAFEPSAGDRAAIGELDMPALLWWPGQPPAWALSDVRDAGHPLRVVAGEDVAGVWRSAPPPVADELFADVSGISAAGSAAASWIGPPTARRSECLRLVAAAAAIGDVAPTAAIAVNLHDEESPACEHRALVALARGQLLVSEPLTPSRGLEPGIDYVEVAAFDELQFAVANALRAPDAFLRTRLRGRRKAELFRASAVVARLAGDLLLELRAGAGAR